MTHDPIEFTITDPRTFEGNPYEVAERAAKQVEAMIGLTLISIDGGDLMARNAYMERNLAEGRPAGGTEWPETPEGKRWLALKAAIASQRAGAKALAVAAGFDPKHPKLA